MDETLNYEQATDDVEPDALDVLAQDLATQPYESAITTLKNTYNNNSWTDKELAAQKVAEISNILNTRDAVNSEITLDTDAIGLTQKILDSSLDDEGKIDAIENWLEESTSKLYQTDDAESLVGASAKERLLKDYALQLRRHIVAGDTGFVLDKIARGAEAMLAPLVDTTDLVFDTNAGPALREYAALHENPDSDSSLTSAFASGAGSVLGFAAAAVNPYTALGYLGATITSQGKQVYDTALEASGSESAAKAALASSAPGILLDAFADRLLGGTLAKTLAGKKGPLGFLTGALSEATTEGSSSYLTGKALASATGQAAFEPQPEQVATEALVGGVLGGIVGGFQDLSQSDIGIKKAHDLFRKNVAKSEDTPPAIAPTEALNTDDFLQQFVVSEGAPPEQSPGLKARLDSLKGMTDIAPINADAIFGELTQYGTPQEQIGQLESILDERNKLGLAATKFPEPLEGEALTAREQELQSDVDEIKRLGDADLSERMQKNLAAWKQQQLAYAQNPENAATVKDVYKQYRELTKKFYKSLEEVRNRQSQVNADVEAQGFSFSETAGDYANWAAGYQVFDVYHGSGSDFEAFSKEKLGSNTGANSAREGFFGAANPETADSYTPSAEGWASSPDFSKMPDSEKQRFEALDAQAAYIKARADEEYRRLENVKLSDEAHQILEEAGEDYYDLNDVISRHSFAKDQLGWLENMNQGNLLPPSDPGRIELESRIKQARKEITHTKKVWESLTALPEVAAALKAESKNYPEGTIAGWKAGVQKLVTTLKSQQDKLSSLVSTHEPDPDMLKNEAARIQNYYPEKTSSEVDTLARLNILRAETLNLQQDIKSTKRLLRAERENLRAIHRSTQPISGLDLKKSVKSRLQRLDQSMNRIAARYSRRSLTYKLKVRAKNPFIVDLKGESYSGLHRTPYRSLTRIIKTAKEAGHDAVVMQNLVDPIQDTVYVWFEPNQARVPWARFNPNMQESPLLNADMGPSVLEAAQAVPPGGVVQEQPLSNLQKIIPAIQYSYTPPPAVTALANKMLGELTDPANPLQVQLADETAMGLMFGYHDPRTGAVVLRRQLFRDQDQARKTLDHEVMHLVDSYNRSQAANEMLAMQPSAKEPVLIKLTRLGAPIRSMMGVAEVNREAKELSSLRRVGWDPIEPIPAEEPPAGTPERAKYDYLVYRNNPNELHADVMAEILERPETVKSLYPNIWAAFEAGLKGQPVIRKFWDDIQAMNKDPQKLSQFLQQERQTGRKREAKATAQSAEKQILLHKELKAQRLREAPGIIRQRFANRFSVARDMVDTAIDSVNKDYVEELYGKLYSGPMSSSIQDALVNEKEVLLFKEVKALAPELSAGVDPVAEMKQLMYITHVLEDTTVEMHNIKEDPTGYREAANIVVSEAGKYAAANNGTNPIADLDVNGKSGQPLVDAIAGTQVYLTHKVRKALTDQIMKDRGWALSDADIKAIEIMDEGAFAARRYIGNPIDPKTAEVDLALMKSRLGEDGFRKLSKLHERHHDILFNYLWPRVKEAGILSPKLEKRFELNKRSYTTFNALKYFEKDPHITASVRKAIGNVNQIGDEWAATIRKTRMVGARADFQIASNAAVELAGKSGVDMKEITPKINIRYDKEGESSIFIDSLYKTQKEMQAAYPENSYLIATEDGKSALFEIKDPRWARMFEKSSMEEMPVLNTGLSLLEDFNRIFGERELKTALSPGFFLRSKFYDRSQESLAGNAPWYNIPGLWFHLSKKFREQHKAAKQYVSEFQRGEVNKAIEGLIKYNGVPHHMTEETGGYYNPALRAENIIYEDLGFKIPGEEELDIPLRINRAINKAFDMVGFGKIRKAVETDELRAKVTMYLVGKNIKGMGDARAARFARELGGTPDPFGGGIEASGINKLFLFGRAHINGMRGLYSMFKDDPKSFSMQYFYRKVMPRLLVSSAVMGPLIGAMFGKEEEDIYRKFLDKMPSFDKLSKFNIPLGFIDDKGHFRGFDVKAEDITQNWKASYLAMPMSRDLVTADTLMNPIFENIENYINNGSISAKRIAQSVTNAFGSSFTGQFAPGIMSATRMSQFISGGNPHDYYRNRGIFPKDVEESGTLLDKTYRYLVWSLNQTSPGIFSFNPDKQSSTEPSTPWDYISSTPVAGATIRAFVRQSNYGDLEKYKELERVKIERDADIRLGMGENSRTLYNDYRKTQAYVSRLGKGWAEHSTPEQIRRVHILQNWHTRAYRHGFNGMRAAFDNDDSAALQRESEKLESASAYVAELLE